MKRGTRALGVAASDGPRRSFLCGALVRVDRVADGFAFATCEVGGDDATDATKTLFDRLDREDVRYVLTAGVAPAWFNLLDLPALAEAVDRPVISVSFEESEGLEPALREQFSGDALDRKLAVYRSLPPRRRVDVGGHERYVRAVGLDDEAAAKAVRTLSPEGGRPEPLRVARLAARAARTAAVADGRESDGGAGGGAADDRDAGENAES